MAFRVTAWGTARRQGYVFGPRAFADVGGVVKSTELVHLVAEIAEVAQGKGAYVGGGGAEMAGNIAHNTLVRLLAEELFWFSENDAWLMISFEKKGVWGGILWQPEYRSGEILFTKGQCELDSQLFLDLLARLKLNRTGYLRGLCHAMSEYTTHCETYGVKPRAVLLRIRIQE